MRFHSFSRLAILLLPFLFLSSCSSDDEEDLTQRLNPSSTPISRTVLVYMIAENNLYAYYHANIEAMIEGYRNAPEGTNWLIYIDDGATPTLSRLYKEKNGTVEQQVIKTYEHQFSTNPNVMNAVLKEAYALYPADSLGLILSSHSDGSLYHNGSYVNMNIEEFLPPLFRAFGQEAAEPKENGQYYGNEASYTMNITDLRMALKGIPHLHYIMFDACLMGNLETAYELRDYAHYMIAAPNSVPGMGFPYEEIVPDLLKMDAYDLTDAIQCYTTDYATNAMGWDDFASCAVYDLTQLESFAASFHEMMSDSTAVSKLNRLLRSDMQLYETESSIPDEYPNYPLYDIGLLIDSIAPAETAQQLHQQLRNLIVQYAHLNYLSVSYDGETMLLPYNSSRVCGLTTYIPPLVSYKETELRTYNATLDWYKDAGLYLSSRYQP